MYTKLQIGGEGYESDRHYNGLRGVAITFYRTSVVTQNTCLIRSTKDRKSEQDNQKAKLYKLLMGDMNSSSKYMHCWIVSTCASSPSIGSAGHVALGQ